MINNYSLSDVFTNCYVRDNHTCQDCGSTENLEVHHIIPISQGGKNKLINLKTVCKYCHKNNYKDVHYPKDQSKIIPFEQREKSRFGINKSKNTQVMITFPYETLDEIEAYWHRNELKNRSEAIRELIQLGLKKESSD